MKDLLNFYITQVDSVEKRNTAVIKTFKEFLNDNFKKHSDTIKKIRYLNEKSLVDKLKSSLPACQFCITNGHGIGGIVNHSTIMQIDIDAKDNLHIKHLKPVVKKIPYVFFAMYSASGKGVVALIKIQHPSQYKAHFEAFKIFVKAKYQISVDSAVSSPVSLRYWSYDRSPIVNVNADVWDLVPSVILPKEVLKQPFKTTVETNPFDDYNKHGDIESLLLKHGWTYQPNYDKGTRKRFSRPGKTTGISADWCSERRVLFVFSSSNETKLSVSNRGVNAVSVFSHLECHNNMKLCASKLKFLGFGS